MIEELERNSSQRPLLLLFDDLQFADAESLRCLKLLVRRLASQRIAIIAASRSAADGSLDESMAAAFSDLLRGAQLRRIDLPPLDVESRFQLLAALWGESVAVTRISPRALELTRVAGGSPFLLAELGTLNFPLSMPDEPAVSHAGVPRVPPRTEAASRGISPTVVRATVVSRMRGLTEDSRRLLGLAAIVGMEFDPGALAAASERPTTTVLDTLAPMAEEGWPIRRSWTNSSRFEFEHDLLRTAVLESHDFDPAPSSVQRLVRWWSSHRAEDPITEARLRIFLGDRRGALACLSRAIDLSLDRTAFRSVPELLRWGGSELGPRREVRGRLIALNLHAAERLREYWESDALGEALRVLSELVGRESVPWQATCWEVETLLGRNLPAAERRLEEIEDRLRRAGKAIRPRTRPLLDYLHARVAWYGSDPETARRLLMRSARSLPESRYPYEVFRSFNATALLLTNEGRWSQAHRCIRAARGVLRRRFRASVRLSEILLHTENHLRFREGNATVAVESVRGWAVRCHRRGDVGFEAKALLQLATFEYALHETEASLGHLDQAAELYSKLGVGSFLLACGVMKGWTYLRAARFTEAKLQFRRARELGRDVDWPVLAWAISIGLAAARAELGDPRGARAEVRRLPTAGRRSSDYRNEYYCAVARILELSGDPTGARDFVLLAVRRARESQAVRTDLIDALSAQMRWEDRYGTPRGRLRCARELGSIALRWRGSQYYRWPLEFETGPAHRGALGGEGARVRVPAPPEEEGSRLSHMILRFLGGSQWGDGRPPPVERPSEAYTEAEIASGLAEERHRFARSLGRLRERGLVERQRAWPSGAPRHVYVYRLTRRGEAAAAALRRAASV